MCRILLVTLLLVSSAAHAQYDDPAPDPVHAGRYQPNEYSRVKNAATLYPFLPYRIEYYRPSNGIDTLGVTFTWDRNYSTGTVRGGKMATPTQMLMGIPRMWQKGSTGAGVKVGVIVLGYSADIPHASITVSKVVNTSSPIRHDYGVISCLAARNNGLTGTLGVAYDADIYVYNAAFSVGDLIDSARVDGCKIVEVSFTINDNQDTRDAVKRFHDAGGSVILAGSDNDDIAVQQGCSMPYVICVGGTTGGSVVAFVDSFNTPASNPRPNDFSLPVWTLGASFDNATPYNTSDNNLYQVLGGTSFAAPQLAGAEALLFGLFSGYHIPLSGVELERMLKRHARSFTDQGVTGYVPDLNFIR